METTGRLVSAVMDFVSWKLAVTFEVDASCAEECRRMAGVEQLDIKATKHRERRSPDANAYFHVLAGKIADSLGLSKARAKNMLICRYGQPELLPDGTPLVYKTNAPPEYMWELEVPHSIPAKFSEENGRQVVFYRLYRGSHTYDSREMSLLIAGTVSAAEDLGIETLTPDELARMAAAWNPRQH